ncbi:tRNA-splicing endonuclease subunit Sen2 [Coccinella septempunctata]|uniref:tRNA-splicing endonuclease subunit Sen2 n=1 Tax=Coccinella septempunctata TaxID=41139 RepID=UPI001D05CC0F|nr:tRNA-splicing endonuclease subunit Sen2 [Coccinella septempunctata]
MDILSPRPKRLCRLPKFKPLPIVMESNGEIYKYQGFFDGFTVRIPEKQDKKSIVSMGCFGKGSLSKSFPTFDGSSEKPEIIRRRQMERRKKWSESNKTGEKRKIIVLPDSDDENDYFTNLQATYDIDECGDKETTNLMLEEAFFLKNAIGCLDVHHEDKILDDDRAWKLFSESDPFFQRNYAVYYHFRSKNWVVKPGIKFGGDYLLYKEGPQFYHASYVVMIKNQINNDPLNTTSLIGFQRMCETSGKELLICSVSLPREFISPDDLPNVTIKEILMKRWVSSQEREENTI